MAEKAGVDVKTAIEKLEAQLVEKQDVKAIDGVAGATSTTEDFKTIVTEALAKGDAVQLVGFGTFDVGTRGERTGRNPKTGESIKIKASKCPKFKAGKALKDSVNK